MSKDWLSDLEVLMMLATMRLRSGAYGVSIQEEVETQTGRRYSFGTIYNVLERLDEKGFVRSKLGEPTRERGGRAKRLYELTANGERTLATTLASRREMENRVGLGGPSPTEVRS